MNIKNGFDPPSWFRNLHYRYYTYMTSIFIEQLLTPGNRINPKILIVERKKSENESIILGRRCGQLGFRSIMANDALSWRVLH